MTNITLESLAHELLPELVPCRTYPKTIRVTPINSQLDISWEDALALVPELETLDGSFPWGKPVRVSLHANKGKAFLTFTPHTRDMIPSVMREVTL